MLYLLGHCKDIVNLLLTKLSLVAAEYGTPVGYKSWILTKYPNEFFVVVSA